MYKTKLGNFFFFDSNCLDDLKTKIYGYTIGPKGDVNNLDFAKEHPNGTYILMQVNNDTISISQDFGGNYGIYLFEKDNYFAISNSFLYLLENVKDKYALTMNYDYVNALAVADLSPLSASETLIQEICVLPRESRVIIDKKNKTYCLEKINYGEHSISVDSVEAMEILDGWFHKWTSVIRGLNDKNTKISVDLSGGFDSRMVFMLFATAITDWNNVRVSSAEDGLHTHKEDFYIASKIAGYYKVPLNRKLENESRPCSMEEIVTNSFYTKLGVHKQMYWRTSVNKEKVFQFTGSGGESIRGLWYKKPTVLISEQMSRGKRYRNIEVTESVARVINKAYQETEIKYNIKNKESEELTQLFYRDTRCRHHFGKESVERIYGNVVTCSPLMDQELSKISLEKYGEPDLLLALLFIRYCPKMLEFEFEGGRSVSQNAIKLAQEISNKYPVKVKNDKYVLTETFANNYYQTEEKMFFGGDVFRYLIKHYREGDCLNVIERYYHRDFFEYALNYAERASYFPLQEVYAIFAICIAQSMVAESERHKKNSIIERIEFSCQSRPIMTQVKRNTFAYLFPFDMVPKNSKILLYGAGKVGNIFYRQLLQSNYCTVVGWCDKQYKTMGNRVENPQIMNQRQYDYIVIAVENPNIVDEIKKEMKKAGIGAKSIIWKNYRVN